MANRQIIVIGASAGGLEALRELVSALPKRLPAPVCIVLHTSPGSPGLLGAILSRAGTLPAIQPRDGERLEPGHIYVAPPDAHLVLEPGVARVTKGPRENRFRPAIDPLFRSAAQVYGPAAIGVILSGLLDDGTAGLWAIKQLGGVAVVQDPEDALFPSMPRNAIAHVPVDHVVPLSRIAPLLERLTAVDVEVGVTQAPEMLEVEVNIAKEQHPLRSGLGEMGPPSIFACPECHGVLLQLKEGERIRFRCHTGHAYSTESLLAGVNEGVEEALWNAVRALEEGELLLRAMASHIEKSHDGERAGQIVEMADDARVQAESIRKMATDREPLAVKT